MSESAPVLKAIWLASYYRKYFPKSEIARWLQYNGAEPGDRRELAFFFADGRFFRWKTVPEMASILDNITEEPPERMEIGPVYSQPIGSRKTSTTDNKFCAEHRELIFDIDSDSFASIKTCCEPNTICPKCWPLMHCALECFIQILKENFGFSHILPVFSGRRGIHIWVCDPQARSLSPAVRKNIVRYFDIITSINDASNFDRMPPLVDDVMKICERHFIELYDQQHIFTDQKLSGTAKGIVGDKVFKAIVAILNGSSGLNKDEEWEAVKQIKIENTKKLFKDVPSYKRLILTFTYMRLDEAVTSTINHLLKSPFSVHPKSGLISVPIPNERFGDLPSTWAPSLEKLMNGDQAATEEYEKGVKQFVEFVDGMCGSSE